MASTITINNIVTFAGIFTELMPLTNVGGNVSEPALTIANDTLAWLLAEKMPWKFNRKELNPLFWTQWKADYQFAGASVFCTDQPKSAAVGLASANAITESVNTVTVTTLEAHPFAVGDTIYMTNNTVAAYNSTFTQTLSSSTWSGGWVVTAVPSTTSFTFTHASSGLAASGAPGVTDIGWMESGTWVDQGDVAPVQSVNDLSVRRMLKPVSAQNNPKKVCLLTDLGTGVVKFRFNDVPANRGQANLVYQAKAPLLTLLTQTWAPFPDEYSFVYRQAFLAHAFKFANSPRADNEFKKALLAVDRALGRDDEEMSDEGLVPDNPINNPSGSTWWGQ